MLRGQRGVLLAHRCQHSADIVRRQTQFDGMRVQPRDVEQAIEQASALAQGAADALADLFEQRIARPARHQVQRGGVD